MALINWSRWEGGFVGLLIEQYGQDGEITREEFMRYGLHAATGYATTQAGSAGQIADYLEEIFEVTGSRGGFMLGHSQCGPRDQLQSIVDLLVPELQRRPVPYGLHRPDLA